VKIGHLRSTRHRQSLETLLYVFEYSHVIMFSLLGVEESENGNGGRKFDDR